MRITKVALAFFSIGFLAGSFERAAGLADAERSKPGYDREANAAVRDRGTQVVVAAIGYAGSGLPDELLARPLVQPAVPDAVAAALPEITEFDAGQPCAGAIWRPQEADDWHLTTVPPLNPDLARHAFGPRRMFSEPDRVPVSRMPAQMDVDGAGRAVPRGQPGLGAGMRHGEYRLRTSSCRSSGGG